MSIFYSLRRKLIFRETKKIFNIIDFSFPETIATNGDADMIEKLIGSILLKFQERAISSNYFSENVPRVWKQIESRSLSHVLL
jgi:hypothetical protein